MGKLNVKKANDWINQGAPEQALDFLGKAVDTLNQTAIEKNIIFKGVENVEVKEEVKNETVTEEVVTKEETVVAQTEAVQTETATEVVTETPTANTQENFMEVIQKGITDAVLVALKEYNESVVSPLQAKLAELEAKFEPVATDTTTKSYARFQNVFLNASDFMPAAAVSAAMKKEFGITEKQEAGEVVVSQEEMAKTAVTEKTVTKSYDPNNVLAGF